MTDRELLELAAKAAGINGQWSDYHNGICYSKKGSLDMHVWRPLDDDGDALRLAVRLSLLIDTAYNGSTAVGSASLCEILEPHNGDHCAATRRAIVRAAASIGEGIQ